MPFLIGTDEAGYGPNLGPLVIGATVWETRDHPADVDLWEAFAEVVTPQLERGDTRLHLADSKAVYSPATGLDRLEATVLSAYQLLAHNKAPSPPQTVAMQPSTPRGGEGWGEGENGGGFSRFCESLCAGYSNANNDERCLCDADLSLPTIADNASLATTSATRWHSIAERAGIRLIDIRCDIVWPRRWNAELVKAGNKAAALSSLTLRLLRSVWNPDDDTPTLIVCDKHGGRNRYDPYLQEITGDAMIFRLQESKEVSRYRIGRSKVQFRARGESQLPVALASMFAKYIRELSMELFNRFWTQHVPGLRPTKGYPVDAKRFRADIAETQTELGIADDDLWRTR